MTRTLRRLVPALFAVLVVALVVASCGQVPPADEAQKAQAPAGRVTALATQPEFDACADATAPTCTPTGAHAKHGAFACAVCHYVAGRLAFQVGGPAYGSTWTSAQPRPYFDAVAKTCSNVACHSMQSGTFSYYFPDGDGNPALNVVTIYGSTGRTTPSWYATGATGCTGCHDNPPRNGSSGSNVWHSGYHGNQPPSGAMNQCQLCHPDATGADGVGISITNPAMHANGVFNVQGRFGSTCFGCH